MELILIADFVLMLLTELQASPSCGHVNKPHYGKTALSKNNLFMERAKVPLGRANAPSVIPNNLLFRNHKRFWGYGQESAAQKSGPSSDLTHPMPLISILLGIQNSTHWCQESRLKVDSSLKQRVLNYQDNTLIIAFVPQQIFSKVL